MDYGATSPARRVPREEESSRRFKEDAARLMRWRANAAKLSWVLPALVLVVYGSGVGQSGLSRAGAAPSGAADLRQARGFLPPWGSDNDDVDDGPGASGAADDDDESDAIGEGVDDGAGPSDDYVAGMDDKVDREWIVYKTATAVTSGSGEEIFDFVTRYLCPSQGAPTDLGCGALKVGCVVRSTTGTVQLHWVDAAALDHHSGPMKVEGWESYFKTLNANMTKFNSFMHNKQQLFVDDLSAYQKLLDESAVAYMRRISYDVAGVKIAHLSVEVAARVVELVGPFDSLSSSEGFEPWRANECPQAHVLRSSAANYSGWADYELQDDISKMWQDKTGRVVPIIAGVAAASHDPVEHGQLVAQLYNFTGARFEVIEDTDDCAVTTITFPGVDGFEFKYVDNKIGHVGEHSLSDYDEYVEAVHQEYLLERRADDASSNWFDWDHWLDQHIGVEIDYVDGECETVNHDIRKVLFENQIPVGERRAFERFSDGTRNYSSHYYTGYKGSLAWEFHVQCSADNQAPDVCGCNNENNNILFLKHL